MKVYSSNGLYRAKVYKSYFFLEGPLAASSWNPPSRDCFVPRWKAVKNHAAITLFAAEHMHGKLEYAICWESIGERKELTDWKTYCCSALGVSVDVLQSVQACCIDQRKAVPPLSYRRAKTGSGHISDSIGQFYGKTPV